ncbi:hypothetical protein ACWDSJ_14260 [Nocardia sp. NPDC003482]
MPDVSYRDPNRAQTIAKQLIKLREAFWQSIRTFDPDGNLSSVSRQTLWFYYEAWLFRLREDLKHQLLLDPDAHYERWQQFLGLTPTLYTMITDDYLQDPSRLDLVTTDAEGHTTVIERRVAMTMPWLDPDDETYSEDEKSLLGIVTDLVSNMGDYCWARVDFVANADLTR